MKESAALSIDRLHRLRPSDIEAIRASTKSSPELTRTLATFAQYLLNLKNPLAIEVDDVLRIALQFKMADVWETIRPADFIAAFQDILDRKIVLALRDALGDAARTQPSSTSASSWRVLEEVRQTLGKGPLPRVSDGLASRRLGGSQLSKSQLIEKIASTTELSKRDVKNVMDTLVDVGHRELKKNGLFLVPGFAKFVVIKKPGTKARKSTNPFTGEEMKFKEKPARKIVRATPLKATKDAV